MTEGTATWQSGEPANLEAAASDALWWLVWLQKSGLVQSAGDRLDNCVLRLREQLEAAGVPTEGIEAAVNALMGWEPAKEGGEG